MTPPSPVNQGEVKNKPTGQNTNKRVEKVYTEQEVHVALREMSEQYNQIYNQITKDHRALEERYNVLTKACGDLKKFKADQEAAANSWWNTLVWKPLHCVGYVSMVVLSAAYVDHRYNTNGVIGWLNNKI